MESLLWMTSISGGTHAALILPQQHLHPQPSPPLHLRPQWTATFRRVRAYQQNMDGWVLYIHKSICEFVFANYSRCLLVGLCDWVQETDDGFDWTHQMGGLVNEPLLGPLYDHTLKNNNGKIHYFTLKWTEPISLYFFVIHLHLFSCRVLSYCKYVWRTWPQWGSCHFNANDNSEHWRLYWILVLHVRSISWKLRSACWDGTFNIDCLNAVIAYES